MKTRRCDDATARGRLRKAEQFLDAALNIRVGDTTRTRSVRPGPQRWSRAGSGSFAANSAVWSGWRALSTSVPGSVRSSGSCGFSSVRTSTAIAGSIPASS